MISAESLIYDRIKSTEEDFDIKNKVLLKETESTILTAHVTKLLGAIKGADLVTEDKIYFITLLLKAEKTIILTFHLARQRSYTEAITLLRVAIETIATAIHISKEPNELEKFLKISYKSTMAISYSKKYIPQIGSIYGDFSKIAVHINSISYGPQIEIIGNELHQKYEFEYGVREEGKDFDEIVLLSIQLVASIVHRAFEIIFLTEEIYRGVSGLSYPGTDVFIFGKMYSEKIEELYNKIKSLNSY